MAPDNPARAGYARVMQLCITRSALMTMLAAARAAHPHEACGLLLGHDGLIAHAQPTRNCADQPERRFEINPAALIAAHRMARSGGPALIGYFHSHPVGPAAPSSTDAAMAAHDGRIWAIVAGDTVMCWRDAPSGFEPLSYDVVAG